ncbi:MAG: sulfide/dihydroorotate dehydrogenase-like FAD/NAD-binding protein [Lachnospiraceae bacterium]|jgi:ferredoxin--NADP+ reductase|nr:sulfide/dihydroorotate dehydrogenase-like FAD/NAD-binding protein [Lachnospiraceae bacterium]
MFKIIKKENLAPNIYLMDVEAPRIARHALPGQFLIVRVDKDGERIPLTICDYDSEKGIVQIVFQVIGGETYRMSFLEEGDSFADMVGPLGKPSDLTELSVDELKKMKICFIAGGVGTAPVYCQLKWLKKMGVEVDCIQGARTKDIIILEKEMSEVSNLHICTDDGSYGINGNVCVALQKLWDEGKRFDRVVAIGPMIMMKFVCQLTKQLGVETIISMNPIMVDGTGMCGACRLMVGDKVKFACVDGPEFDGHQVDFAQAMQRMKLYATEEGRLYLKAKEGDTHHGGCGNCAG